MSKNKVLIVVLWAILVIIFGGLAWVRVRAVYQQQLAPAIVLQDVAAPAASSTPTLASQAKTCGQSGVMTFLVLARDVSNGVPPYGADLIRFVRIDFDQQTVRVIAIPRDLYVATPHLAALNLDHSRLGPIYYQVEQHTTGTQTQIATAATSAVAQALYDNYGVTADHYIFFEMKFFAQALDQLGGLDVNIPVAITDGQFTFPAGQQHLDGAHVLQYARLLPVDTELQGGWDRFDRQNVIFKAFLAKMLEPASLVKIPALLKQFQGDFTTDLSPELITDLTCLAGKVSSAQVTTLQLEKSMITGPGPDSSMLADTEKVKTFLQEQLAR